MPPPTISVLVDWDNNGNFSGTYDDITADVGGTSPSAVAVKIRRGMPADFGSGAPSGSAVLVVRNDGDKYTPNNASSPLSGNLRVGRPVWITAVYSAVTYGLFAGTIARIVADPRTDMATIVCTDMIERYGRYEAAVPDSTTRSLKGYRTAILDAIGESATRRDLAEEPEIPGYTGERTASALDLLSEINESTLARHFIRAGTAMPDWYYYTTRDRHYKLDGAVLLTINDTLADMSGLEVNDDTLINTQFVTPSGRAATADTERVWSSPELPISVSAGTSQTFWADFDDPVIGPSVVSTATGSPTITLTALGTSAKIVVTAGVAATISQLDIYGKPAIEVSDVRVVGTNAASITTYGQYVGTPMTASLLTGSGYAKGLADHMVFRFAEPRQRPVISLVNDWPTLLQIEPYEPIALTFARLSLTSRRYEVTGIDLAISADRNTWTGDWQLQEALSQTALSFFRVGGTAAEGVGGTGILAY